MENLLKFFRRLFCLIFLNLLARKIINLAVAYTLCSEDQKVIAYHYCTGCQVCINNGATA